jgi:hypothetical protein
MQLLIYYCVRKGAIETFEWFAYRGISVHLPVKDTAPMSLCPFVPNRPLPLSSSQSPVSKIKFAQPRRLRQQFLLAASVALGLLAGSASAQTTSFPGTTPVGQSTAAVTVTVNITSTGMASAPVVVTQGASGLGFAQAGGGTCAAGVSYTAGQSCTVNVTFTPVYPGMRMGAVEILNAAGGVLGEALLTGMASGPLAVLAPGRIDTVAGDALWVYNGDGEAATVANIFLPMGLVTDGKGNLFLSDANNNRIRRVDAASGAITTVAGTGIPGFGGDGGPATSAQISLPGGIAMDGAGNLYVADQGNSSVRRIDAVTGIITTVAGNDSTGYTGDGGLATAAQLNLPEGVALDGNGNLYIADTGNNVVRMVSPSGIITTVAGTGTNGYSGDGGPATAAKLASPWSVLVTPSGTLLVSDFGNNRVRQVIGGTITTFAGVGTQGFSGDGSSAAQAQLAQPASLTMDPAGDLFIGDSANNRVREVLSSTGVIQTVAGTGGEQFAGDGGPSNLASLYGPYALYFDQTGDLFIADMFHNRVRRISGTTIALSYPDMKEGKTSAPQTVNIANDGNADLHPQSPVFSQSALDSATTTCATGVAVTTDATCTLGVEFTPNVVASPDTGSLTQPSDAGNSPIIVTLTANVLSVNPVTMTLTSSANPSSYGSSVTFTANVTAADAVTGSVAFTDGSTVLCSAAGLDANGVASCTANNLALGSHTINATYTGDSQNAAAMATLTQLVQQQDTLTLTATPNPAAVTENVTFSFTATAASGTATGTAKFYDGTTLLSSQPLASGGASLTLSTLSVGSHTVTVQYSGDASYMAGTSNPVTEVINSATSTTTLSTSAASVPVGTTVIFTATVTGSNGQTPTGSVTFKDGGTALGTSPLGAGNMASFSTSTLAPGPHTITAVYGGDGSSTTSTSSPITETVGQLTTTTSVVSSANPTSAGATIQLTATVAISGSAAPDGAITGVVAFTTGGTTLGTANVNASGVAVLSTNALNAGSQPVVATYNGNTNYAGSSSISIVEVVNQTATTTSASATPLSPQAGQTVTVTATITSTTIAPPGSVTFTENGVSLGTGTLTNGIATLTSGTLPTGTNVITVTYVGDSNYIGSSSAVTVVVTPATSATILSASTNPQAFGQPVIFTAAVSSADTGIGGSVSFLDGATTIGMGAVNASGLATFTTSTLAFGPHTITAVYGGDTNHATSTSTAVTERIVQQATALLSSSANPAAAGQNITFTTKVTGAGSTPPTGTITFSDGAVTLGTGTLDATGTATLSTATLAVGMHAITVSYPGDTNYSAATASLPETVQTATTQVTIAASANPAIYAAPVTLTATVSSNGGPASGTVTFLDGATTIGTATLNGSGMATLAISTLSPGSHSITASYGGNGSANASISTAVVLVVQEMTQVTLVSSENPAYTLDNITFTAPVTNSGVGVPTGTVTFADGPTKLGSVTVGANGEAVLGGITLTPGNHSITASYSGDATDIASISTALVEGVTLRPTNTMLTATNANPNDPQAATLIAVVRWTGAGTTIPTGTVTFTSGGNTIGTAKVDSTGVATLDVELQSASETIVAAYGGDTNYALSTSIATSITGGAASQFSIGVTPAQMSLPTGQHTVVTVTLSSVSGFNDTMEMGCLGLPVDATCTFSNVAPALAANGVVTMQLTVDTGDPLGSGATTSLRKPALRGEQESTIAWAMLPAGLLLSFGLYKRRRLGALLVLLFAVALSIGTTGCSGLHQASTPAGTYQFKVTASGKGTGATESQVVTLTVTQ